MQSVTSIKPTAVINTTIKFGFIITGSLLFNMLFWKEKMAINAILFFVFICVGILQFYPKSHNNRKVRWLFLATLLSLAMVVLHNTLLSKIAFVISLFLMASYSQYSNNSLLYAGASIFQSVLYFIPAFYNSITQLFPFKHRKFGIAKKLHLFIFPIVIVGIFFVVYLMANKVFANVAERMANKINDVFAHLLNWVEPQRLMFSILGLLICGGLLVRYIKAPLEEAELTKNDSLKRTRKNKTDNGIIADMALVFMGKLSTGTLALKSEYKSCILCLILLNALLFLVNTTDVIYVWFGFNYTHDLNLTKLVHEGAALLVISILLAMLVVLFFFRGNLNFFAKNKYLKTLAHVWILQNAILAFSVCVRNFYYIQHMGLAYKRVGLVFFILLVFIGLTSIIYKINKIKSTYYLWRINAMAAFIILVLSTCIDWGVAITNYNIHAFTNNKKNIDINFLIQMNDHVLPLLENNKSWILKSTVGAESLKFYAVDSSRNKIVDDDIIDNCTILKKRIADFYKGKKEYSWLSWNWADKNTSQELAKLNAHP